MELEVSAKGLSMDSMASFVTRSLISELQVANDYNITVNVDEGGICRLMTSTQTESRQSLRNVGVVVDDGVAEQGGCVVVRKDPS